MLKNYVRTVKCRDVMENMVHCDCESSDTNEYVYERILSYSEDEIKTYFVVDCGGWYYNGGIATYSRHPDGEWHMYEHVSWSGRGSADDAVWRTGTIIISSIRKRAVAICHSPFSSNKTKKCTPQKQTLTISVIE